MNNLMKKENLMILGAGVLAFLFVNHLMKPKESTEVNKPITNAGSETKSDFCGCGA